ncbi:MAG: hypothetical protein R8K20_08905 [Gallionellaceae bacterium]
MSIMYKLPAMLVSLRGIVAILLVGMLSACSDGSGVEIPTQKWQEAVIRVESHPSPPTAGMNEFVVIASGKRRRAVGDLVVSLRTDDHDAWIQAIQDGQLGIYRRAAEVNADKRSVLQVQIRRNGEESILRFPLTVAK